MGRGRTLPDHVCPTCHRVYRPRSHDQTYCTPQCRRGRPAPLICDDLREEVEAAKAERATAPLYRYWSRHV